MPTWTVRQILGRIAAGATSVESVVESYLARVRSREDAVGAWAYIDPDGVMAQARRLDAAAVRGPLHGLPLAVKDTFDTVDMPTEYGSPIYRGHRPVADAAVVAKLRAAGAVIMGKSVTTEFAAMHPGKTRNPHNLAHTPGGSSSGSAAAVADGMVPLALGSQTMGSLIRPAAYCGVVAYKPSFGTLNRAGVKPQAETLDTLGLMGLAVEDLALVTSVLVDGKLDASQADCHPPPRIAVYRGPDWIKAQPPAITALDAAISRLRDAGATVLERKPSDILEQAYRAQLTLASYEIARGLSSEWLTHREQFSAPLAEFVRGGAAISFDEYTRAEAIVLTARRWMFDAFDHSDLWLTISAPGEAPCGWHTGDVAFNRLWTALHLPIVTLPVGIGPAGLPLGVQLIGRYRDDARLLTFAQWAEAQLRSN